MSGSALSASSSASNERLPVRRRRTIAPSRSARGTRGSATTLYWRAIRAAISLARAAATRMRISPGRCGRPAVSAAMAGGISSCFWVFRMRGGFLPPSSSVSSTQLLPLRTYPSGHDFAAMSGSSGSRQLGHFPIIPFWAQLTVGFGLHLGHLPVVPSGQYRTMSWQLGHFASVFPGHFGGVVLMQNGHLPTVPLRQLWVFVCGVDHWRAEWFGGGLVLWPADMTNDGPSSPCRAGGAAVGGGAPKKTLRPKAT